MLKYIPNALTVVRFLLIPFIIISVLQGNYILAFILFTLSGITDIADGFIARKYNLISNFGKLMDPLADKLTQISMLTILSVKSIIPVWILIIVIAKEITMVAGASFLYGKDVVVYSRWYGKLATVLFYIAIVTSLIFTQFNITSGVLAELDLLLYCLALLTTIFALIMYVKSLYEKGFINKEELKKDVTIDKKERKKSSS